MLSSLSENFENEIVISKKVKGDAWAGE